MPASIPLILDTFTDTDGTALTAHTGDSGNTWTADIGNSGTALSISGNRLSVASVNGNYKTGVAVPSDATVMIDCSPQASPIGDGLVLNSSNPITGGGYIALPIGGNWTIFKGNGSGLTSLGSVAIGSEFPTTNFASDQYTMRLIRRTASGTATITLAVNGIAVLTVTDASPPSSGSPGIYSANSGTGTIDNFRAFSASSEIGIVMIGDSITYGYQPGGGRLAVTPDIILGTELSRGKNGLPVTVKNAGVSSTNSVDWVNGTNGASLSAAITSIQNQPIKYASLMIGVNDGSAGNRLSIATHKANVATICATLNAAGIAVVLHRPTYVVPGSFGGGVDAAQALTYIPGYWDAQQQLINGSTIFRGDTQGNDFTATDSGNRLGDGVHPVQMYSRVLFQLHSQAMLAYLTSQATISASYVF